MKIYKFDLGTIDSLLRSPFTIQIPEEFKIVKTELMGEDYNVFIWILADWDNAPKSDAKFQAFGTGWDIDEAFVEGHIETFLVPDELTTYVWHLFGAKV